MCYKIKDCSHISKCVHWHYRSLAVKTKDSKTVCGVKDVVWTDDNTARHCDFLEASFATLPGTKDKCRQSCIKLQNCTHFTWNTELQGTCQLKSGRIHFKDAYVTSDETMTCGIVEQAVTSWKKDNYSNSCEFRGNNFMTLENIDATKCRLTCVSNKLCNHFTWIEQTFLLKSGKIFKSDAVFNNDPFSVCGFISERLYWYYLT